MAHFAVIAPPFTSHVRALQALAGELLDRGHRVSWLQQADVRAELSDARIRFVAVGAETHPPGTLAQVVARAARPGGPWGVRRVIDDMAQATDMLCREGAPALRALGVDALLADEMEAAGGLLAGALDVPFVSIAAALPVQREPGLPLPVMPWAVAGDKAGLRLAESSARVYDWLMQPHARVIARHAEAFGLPPHRALHGCLSTRLRLSQATLGFDFPRKEHGPLRYVGPLRSATAAEPMRWPIGPARDPAKPLVFASLGTLQGGRFGLFRRIARACRAQGVQLLLAHCDRLDARRAEALQREGATWVTGFAPQQAVLAQADVAITHAGLNTVMDALAAGTPMVALPIAFDQPGVAARIVHAGAGLRVHPALATPGAIGRALHRLLNDVSFTCRARALGAQVRAAGGVRRAADLVEQALGLRRSATPSRPTGVALAQEASHA